MRIFVASWFFPPSTSSEGIVGFKLLSHSKHQYDVCSSLSNKWGFDAKVDLCSDNIRLIQIQTDTISEWVEFAVNEFEKNHKRMHYDCIMTRSMPPESIEVGKAIKEKHPEIPWIASLADPISRDPGMMRLHLDKNKTLSAAEKAEIRIALSSTRECTKYIGRFDNGVDLLCEYKNYEVSAIDGADMLIFPNGPQAEYVLCGKRSKAVSIVPHSFDEDLYGHDSIGTKNQKEFVFLGQSYKTRSLEPFIHALHYLRINNPDAAKKIKVRLIGRIADDSKDLVYNYYLNDIVRLESGVNYLQSLKIMRQADWLIHVDGYFKQFESTGGSVYLAGKLADYMGAGKPIFAITGKHTPAERLVSQYGGVCFDAWDKQGMACALERILNNTLPIEINTEFAKSYESSNVAKKMDSDIEKFLFNRSEVTTPPVEPELFSPQKKLMSICIPSFNVEDTLERTIESIVECKRRDSLEVFIVNDGSKDSTRSIAEKYVARYPNVVNLVNKENGGHGSTINCALRRATGEYFRVLDGDDWVDPDELNRLLMKIDGLTSHVDLISTDYCQINSKTGAITKLGKSSDDIAYDKLYNVDELDLREEYLSMHSTTYRTQILRDCSLSLFEHCFYVDVQYQMQPLPFVKTIMFTDGNLYHYSIGNNEQSVSKTSMVARYENHNRVMRDVIQNYYAVRSSLSSTIQDYCDMLVLDHFVETQFKIALVWDSSLKRGIERARDFDTFLKDTDKSLYDAVGQRYSTVSLLRRVGWNMQKVPKVTSLNQKNISGIKKAARVTTQKIMRGGVGTVIAKEVSRKQKR